MRRKVLYIFKNFLKLFLIISLIFVLLFLVIQILDDLASFLKGEKIFIFKNYLYTCPLLFVQISPIITILSVMLVLSEMIKNSELRILFISGIKPLILFYIFLLCGFSSSILTFSVKNFVSPVLLKKINRILEVSVVFTSSNYFFHSEKVEGKKFINVEFTEYFEEGNFRTYKAEIAENYKNNNWIFKNGFLWEFDRMKNLVKKGKFDFINIEIPLTAEILTISNIDVETYSFFQLFKIIRDMKKIKLNPVSLKCYLHEKISYPLLNLFMVFVIYGFLKRSSKISNLYVFSFSFLFSFFIYFFYIFMFSLSKNARIPPFLGCWLIQIFLIIHFLVTKKMES